MQVLNYLTYVRMLVCGLHMFVHTHTRRAPTHTHSHAHTHKPTHLCLLGDLLDHPLQLCRERRLVRRQLLPRLALHLHGKSVGGIGDFGGLTNRFFLGLSESLVFGTRGDSLGIGLNARGLRASLGFDFGSLGSGLGLEAGGLVGVGFGVEVEVEIGVGVGVGVGSGKLSAKSPDPEPT